MLRGELRQRLTVPEVRVVVHDIRIITRNNLLQHDFHTSVNSLPVHGKQLRQVLNRHHLPAKVGKEEMALTGLYQAWILDVPSVQPAETVHCLSDFSEQERQSIEIDLLDVFIGKRELHVARHRGRETNRTVRRQIEFRLPFQLRPSGVDKFYLHTKPFLSLQF